MDNEQPWIPPEPQKVSKIPSTKPEVPEVTLFSPSNKPPANNKPNLLQRAKANEKVFSNTKQQPLLPSSVPNNAVFNKVQPSVPDLSIFDPLMNPTQQFTPAQLEGKSQTNPIMVFQKSNRPSKENIYSSAASPLVPDVTILDEAPKKIEQQPQNNQVFSESYKKLLIKSHEQFIKQMKNDVTKAEPSAKPQRRKPGIFSGQYQDNPLRKYAPKPQPMVQQNDGNSSSILIELDDVTPPENEEKTDEMTFKKVAEMLHEIQKLVIPEPQEDAPKKQYSILRQLASTYLSPEEMDYYEVEKELNEMEQTIDS